MSDVLALLDTAVSKPETEAIENEKIDGLYACLFSNPVYKMFTEFETEYPDKLVSTTFWWVIAVGITDKHGNPVFNNKLQMAGPVPTIEEANVLGKEYGHPAGRKLMDLLWEDVMKFNGYITAKEGTEGKK